MKFNSSRLLLILLAAALPMVSIAQVNTVVYGKNRVQFKKFKWKFYQTQHFNTYFNQDGLELGKYVAQVAEEELAGIQKDVESSQQGRTNIIIYNTYDDYKQSNIGIGIDWQNAGGLTKLVNSKMVLYFNGDHNILRRQIREGIARTLVDNMMFGDDIGEVASNAALLDLPKWLTDGYVDYIATPWSTELDDQLKDAMLSGDYKSFYQFAFDKPTLAGHGFWYYVAQRYKKENVTYFLYLTRLHKSLNKASKSIFKKKFTEVLADFMDYEQDLYYKDLKQRRNAPKGKLDVVEEAKDGEDFYRFAANPNPKNNSYAVVHFKKGIYTVKFVDASYEDNILLKQGFKTYSRDVDPNYPLLAWDGKGSRLLVIYWKEGKINMFVYDVVARFKRFQQQIEGFDQITSAGFMFDAGTLLFSAVKNGHSDLYTYKIDGGKIKAITNDVYDDLDPTVVSFPNRSGVIFASNRPGPHAVNADTVLPSKNHFNIFLVDLDNTNEIKQFSQLTKVKYGNARSPMQYNVNHFTYINDENGIANRWAGLFTTQRDGLDTLYYIGDEVLHNANNKDIDSTLKAWQKSEPDSISYFQVYKDSTYTFPITNYQSSLLETRIAGNNGQVSEVRREGDLKFLYKLRVDSVALRKRNVNARPTEYIKKLLQQDRLAQGKAVEVEPEKPANRSPKANVFQNEFENEKQDSAAVNAASIRRRPRPLRPAQLMAPGDVLEKAKLYNYKYKFSADYVLAGITNNILVNQYQPYNGGTGPVQLNNGSDIDFSFRVGVSDLMEDIKFIGGIRFGSTLADKDVFLSFQNLRRRIDWGFTYYRSNVTNFYDLGGYDNMLYTNLYQGNVSYPFDETKRLQLTYGLRVDKGVIRSEDLPSLAATDTITKTVLARLEYVYDNTINPTQNIYNGLRWKVYSDLFMPVGDAAEKGKHTINLGFDARYYLKIYRNFIWATRAAGDLSTGGAKLLYYLGGVDGWVGPKFNNNNQPSATENYIYQTLAVNMRGFDQNVANGNNDLVINSELRLPVFTTFSNRPINNAFVRNFQLVQFFDLGSAWTGGLNKLSRPSQSYTSTDQGNPVTVTMNAPGIGPFAGGYGFGARSTLLGYFLKIDAGWPMRGFFRGSPIWYFALGFDF